MAETSLDFESANILLCWTRTLRYACLYKYSMKIDYREL